MKARLFMFMALVLGLVSCQNDPDELNVSMGGEQEVMLTVSLPEATRADSADGALDNNVLAEYDLRYILEVYYGENCNRFVQTSTSSSAVFPVRLAPGRTYTFAVWADFVAKGADAKQDIDLFYETSAGLKNISIDEDKWAPMVEARDAYTSVKTVTDFQTSSNLEMKLTRPFAKVRVVSTDIEQLRGVGIVPTKAEAAYSQNMYRKFNAVTGVASDAATKTHTFAYANVDSYEANTDSKLTIFTDYIFVPAEGVAKFTLEVWDGETPARSIKHNNFNTDIFVEKNKITSIVGDVLTTGGNVKVTIDGELGEKETITVVDNAQSLKDAIDNAPAGEETTIELGGDIDLGGLTAGLSSVTRAGEPTYALLVDAGKEIVLDLKGFTISYEKTQTANFSMIQNDGKLTIIDSSVAKTGLVKYADKGQGGNYGSNTIGNSGELIISGGTIENSSVSAVAENGYPHPIDNNKKLTINDGTITNNADYSSLRIWCTTDDDTEVIINGGTFNGSIDFHNVNTAANKGVLTINGGTFNADSYTKSAVRLLGFGVDVDEMFGYIKGGTFNGEIKLRNYVSGEFNSKVFAITGGTFSTDPSEFVDSYYVAVERDGKWVVERRANVAKVGDVEYTFLSEAINAATNGATITLLADVEQVDGVLITDKNITIDLNNKTFTVSNGANTNNRNFKINGSSVVTIKNGTMVAAGDYTSGAYGTVRTEDTANVTLESVILRNYRGNGLNVKALSGTKVTINNTEIYSEYGGGIESAGGIIELTNVKVEQKGMYTAPYNSMAISVNGGGTVTVNSGTYSTECITAEEADNQGTSHGPWCAGVLNSGGTLIIKGGTFSNDNYGDNTLATDARGLLLADTGANIQIEGGTFNAVKSIIDIQNNLGDASKNPSAIISGGDFSANPLTWDGLIKVEEGYMAVDNGDGTWSVVQYTPFSVLVEKVINGNGTYVGQGETYTIMPTSGDAREQGVAATVPNRLQKYSNPEVYYAQYQLFAELGDVNISNVEIEFIPTAITVQDAWNPAGATTTKDNVNGEVQFMNSGKVTLTNCVFNTVSVSPINAPQLAVSGCEFNELKAYAIKDVKAGVVNISNNEFNNCNGGFWFNAAPSTVVAKMNTLSVGRRGAIQFSATGDYTNSIIDIADNVVVGALLWQLNETLPYQTYKTIIENNTYTTAYVAGSFIPEPDVAKIGDTYYKTFAAAVAAAKAGDTIEVLDGTFEGLFDFTGKKGITIEAVNKDMAVINGLVWLDDCQLTFKGIKMSNPNGVQRSNPQNSQYYNTINNQYPLVGAYNYADVRFEECTFDLVGPTVYGFYGYAHNTPEFVNCTFNCNKIRPIASNGDSMTVTGCTFVNQYHYSVRIFENSNERQTVIYTNNTVTGSNDKGEFEGVNISKKGENPIVSADFTFSGNTEGLKYRYHKLVTLDASCTGAEVFEREE